MFIVKADNPDVGYSIVPPTVTDSEGNAVPVDVLDFDTTSSDDNVVSITQDSETTGSAHFGSPGLANINVTVSHNGVLLGSFGAQFTVTAGDPAAIAGGSISFEGLTEA